MIKKTVSISMGDGVNLATDVYLPDEDGKYPALLIFTPYGRKNKKIFADMLVPQKYALVVQDVRGRYDSGGQYEPICQERTDAPETIDWIAGQPWYDDNCGMGVIGISYLAAVGLICAAKRPEHIRTMTNVGGFADTYDISHRGGALVLHHLLPWSILTSFSPQPDLQDINWNEVYCTLPLEEAAEAAGFDNTLWRSWSQSSVRDVKWESMSLVDLLPDVDIPILHATGWYDLCLGTTLSLYDYFSRNSDKPQHLFVGPWTHNGVLMGPEQLHGVEFGPESRPNVPEHIGKWFARWLKEGPTAEKAAASMELTADDNPVAVFMTDENKWVKDQCWPPRGTETVEYYLHGDSLTEDVPSDEGSRSYTHDPDQPLLSEGGAVWEFPIANLNPGPADQSNLYTRDDILLFTSEQLSEEISICGPVQCVLHAATDGRTTDFVAKLVDIDGNGAARYVCDGIVRAHLRNDDSKVQPVQPGRTYKYEIDMLSAAHTFAEGHRVGLEISSSNFPKWDRNLNSLDGKKRQAQQAVFWGKDDSSKICLPVVK